MKELILSKLKKYNIKNLLLIIIISLLLFVPLIYYYTDYWSHFLVFLVLLVSIGIFNKYLYIVTSIFISLVTLFIIHIEFNWGGGFIKDRIAVALESPTYETYEYLKVYISYIDISLIIYFIVIVFFALLFIKKVQIKIFQIISIFIIISLIIFIDYKQKAIMTNPSVYIISRAINGIVEYYTDKNSNKKVYNLKKEKIECSNKFDKLLIVIGESANRNHFSLYGYKRKTTPFLDSLGVTKLNAIAPTNQTRYSVPMLISHGNVFNPQNIFRKSSLIEELKQCGYETYWISNQGRIGVHDTDITSLGKKADYVYFTNKEVNNNVSSYDSKIYKYMKNINIKSNKKQAFFIHLMGSHQYYGSRTPKKYKYFATKSIIDEYDNTIHYTDMILSKIFNLFPKDKLLFAYVSDHSDVVSETKAGHGFIPSYKDEYEIPLIIWPKINFENTGGGMLKSRYINTESFNYLIRYLVGIDEKPKLSYSTKVIDVNLKNIKDFKELNYYEK